MKSYYYKNDIPSRLKGTFQVSSGDDLDFADLECGGLSKLDF